VTPPGCGRTVARGEIASTPVDSIRWVPSVKDQRVGCSLTDSDDRDTRDGQGVHQVVQIPDRAVQPTIYASGAHYPERSLSRPLQRQQ